MSLYSKQTIIISVIMGAIYQAKIMGRIKWAGLLDVSTNAVSSANFTVTLTLSEPLRLLVCRENRTGEISVPWGAQVDVTGDVELSTLTLLSSKGNLLCGQVKK